MKTCQYKMSINENFQEGYVLLRAEEIGKRIKEKQIELGYRQKEIIEKTGISKAAISNYINGSRVPDTESILKLSIALETTIEWLLTGKSTNENLSEEEKLIIKAYRETDPAIQTATKKLLDVKDIGTDMEKLSSYRTG